MKKNYLILILFTFAMLLSGCSATETVKKETSENSNAAILESSTDYNSKQTQAVDEIEVTGEPFTLVCKYDTGDYSLSDWRVTDNKIINMTVSTNGLPADYKVYIEHVHADVILKSTSPQIDGITQDTMDDQDHRIPTNGFPISDTITYNSTFAIEGYTEQFYQLWGYAYGSYGKASSSYKKLTEDTIREAGTYAEKLAVVYDIVISTPECEEGYVKSVYSELLIPLPELERELQHTTQKDVDVLITDVSCTNTTPPTYQTTIKYKYTEYTNTDKETYEKFKGRTGEHATATLEIRTYTDGYIEQCIVEVK